MNSIRKRGCTTDRHIVVSSMLYNALRIRAFSLAYNGLNSGVFKDIERVEFERFHYYITGGIRAFSLLSI